MTLYKKRGTRESGIKIAFVSALATIPRAKLIHRENWMVRERMARIVERTRALKSGRRVREEHWNFHGTSTVYGATIVRFHRPFSCGRLHNA